jgi:deoxycytidylate deaminase
MLDSDLRPPSPELVIALVGALGSDLDAVSDRIAVSLSRFGYRSLSVRVSALFAALASDPPKAEDERIMAGMDAGTGIREKLGSGDATIGFAVQKIISLRGGETPLEHTVYLIRSLKNPEEVLRLRKIYRHHFVCVGVYSPRQIRVSRLAEQIAHSRGQRTDENRARAETLVQRDEKELGKKLGQNVRDAFPLADYFVNASDTTKLSRSIDRLWDIFFGKPSLSPTRDEFGMFHASSAALRSSALSRQVGAAICSFDGDVISLGMNEVPKSGGGHYWCDDDGDARDHTRGHDQNDRTKRTMARELLHQLSSKGWLKLEYADKSVDELLGLGLTGDTAIFRDTIFAALTEFGREVHAEMSAITSAARLGVPSKGCVMYVTTFPCHNCAKHIIASGISRLVYVEPYPKSFAAHFHEDSIAMDATDLSCTRSVNFQAFEGVAPRRYGEWFQWGDRKNGDGSARVWNPIGAAPRFVELNFDQSYREREDHFLGQFQKELEASGLLAG